MTIRHYKRKATIALISLLILLAVTFITAITNPHFQFLNIGLPSQVESTMIATFSLCTMLLITWEIKHL